MANILRPTFRKWGASPAKLALETVNAYNAQISDELAKAFYVPADELEKPAYQAGKTYGTRLWKYYGDIERRVRELAGAAAEEIRLEARNFDNGQVMYISTMGVVVASVAIEFGPRFSQKT